VCRLFCHTIHVISIAMVKPATYTCPVLRPNHVYTAAAPLINGKNCNAMIDHNDSAAMV
jgi:hypothetical protein